MVDPDEEINVGSRSKGLLKAHGVGDQQIAVYLTLCEDFAITIQNTDEPRGMTNTDIV